MAQAYSREFGYVTTRQDVQFHFMQLEHVIPALWRLAEVGLTTREAGGNVVRNVTCDPLAGVCRDAVFDVTPYARAISEHFLRNPSTQALPRKVKIAISGCPKDHAVTAIHDIGAIAVERSGERGFRVFVGGGLGTVPRPADVLEDFVPAAELVRTCDAVLRVFNRLGERKTRVRSRLKFLVGRVGIDAFRSLVGDQLQRMVPVASGLYASPDEREEARPPDRLPSASFDEAGDEADFWRRSNVLPQRQEPYHTIEIALPAGAVTAEQLAVLAMVARGFGDGSLRTTIRQNVVLRWVHEADLTSVHRTLDAYGLAKPTAGTVLDPVACPGAETCASGITNGKALARAIIAELGETGWLHARAHINVSGCPNACGQHYLGDIGLAGCATHVNGRLLPTYQLFVRGRDGSLAEPVQRIAARQAPGAIHALLERCEADRAPGESVRNILARLGAAGVRGILADYARFPAYAEDPMAYVDWDSNKLFSLDERGEGECSV